MFGKTKKLTTESERTILHNKRIMKVEVTNNGFILKTRSGPYVYKNENELIIGVCEYIKTIKQEYKDGVYDVE